MWCKAWVFVLLMALVAAAGCKKQTGPAGIVPVTGFVTLDGQPVAEAQVSFVPSGAGGKGANAATDSSGRFSLTTIGGGDGALPGEYKVGIVKTIVTSLEEDPKVIEQYMATHQGAGPPAKVEVIVPEQYNAADTSGLKATVKDGEKNDFTFALKK